MTIYENMAWDEMMREKYLPAFKADTMESMK